MAEATDAKRPGARKLIAIVEDDPGLNSMFRDMLECVGDWNLRFFNDGQEAKDCLPELGAHLILLDVGLPNLDGASLYKILKGHSKTKDTPIIMITGSHDWELHRMGLQSGLLLRKPFYMHELMSFISALLPDTREASQ
ncbi:response regulator transcription factor [Ktedonospora formicarum]|uniref:response regulator transcription factor n=1 Tax=Ktedonospora formicarum TaxID=2778364 RepID=UPI001C68FD40|nr:response regulator [Ktedonospora formicarum]